MSSEPPPSLPQPPRNPATIISFLTSANPADWSTGIKTLTELLNSIDDVSLLSNENVPSNKQVYGDVDKCFGVV
jgi:hypothetical protein